MATIAELEQVNRLRTAGVEVRGLAMFDLNGEPCDVCVHTRSIPNDLAQRAVVNGLTVFGMWAQMCLGCFRDCGVGLGEGRGQALLSSDA